MVHPQVVPTSLSGYQSESLQQHDVTRQQSQGNDVDVGATPGLGSSLSAENKCVDQEAEGQVPPFVFCGNLPCLAIRPAWQ